MVETPRPGCASERGYPMPNFTMHSLVCRFAALVDKLFDLHAARIGDYSFEIVLTADSPARSTLMLFIGTEGSPVESFENAEVMMGNKLEISDDTLGQAGEVMGDWQ